MPVGEQIAILYCGVHGLLHDVPIDKVRACQDTFLETMRDKYEEVLASLSAGQLTDEATKTIEETMADVTASYKVS